MFFIITQKVNLVNRFTFWHTASPTASGLLGFVFGYLAYDMIHYATHHFSMKETEMGLWLKHYHSKHHYQDEKYGFGVSSPLWDYVFRTTRPPKAEEDFL